MLNINPIHCASRYSYVSKMNGVAMIEFQDNQPTVCEYNNYKNILWVLNLLWNLTT